MLKMGYNLRIVAGDADIGGFLLVGIPDKTMPESYLQKLAAQQSFSYNHLLATLEGKTKWRGLDIVLTGIAPEVAAPGEAKGAMTAAVAPGTAYVGYRIAEILSIHKGDLLDLNGQKLKVERCLAESGELDDMRIQCSLKDAQEILSQPGRISAIKAVDCLCFAQGDPVATLRKEIAAILPDVQVFQAKSLADTRAKQRQMIRNIFAVLLPFVLIACGVWIGVLAIMNVRDRRPEIGLLRALGYSAVQVMILFLGKAVLVGLVGAGTGYLVGTGLGLHFGPAVFEITAKAMLRPELSLFVRACLLAPLFAVVASFIPTIIAVTYDPATTLREE
jgi:ABC-type lipoprotein release transport system permease subunit